MTISHPFEAFAAYMGSRDKKTITAYLTTLHDLERWLASRPGGVPFRVELLTETAIRGYLDSLAAAGKAPRTRSKALSAIGRFCEWAIEENLLRRNPTRQVERPTVIAMSPHELTEDQRYLLKNLVEQQESPRLSAIFALAYWAGLRISEIATLRLGDCEVNQRSGTIVIRDGKGGKTRILDLHNMARRALHDYLEEPLAARDRESCYVFTGQRAAWLRQQGQPDHLSSRGIEHLWKHLKTQADHQTWQLIKDVRFHDLRHDWAHRARAAGWHLEEIAVYAGHQTRDGAPAISTTARYTLPGRQQLKAKLQTLPG